MNLLLLINYYCHTLSKNRSMAVRRDPRKGIKMSKEQITVLLACSADGYKLKRLVIAKAENPHCFCGIINKAWLPVIYRANKKAWMKIILFKEQLERLNAHMKLQKRNILLFVDNCSAHLSNVKLVFLPPNTTLRPHAVSLPM